MVGQSEAIPTPWRSSFADEFKVSAAG